VSGRGGVPADDAEALKWYMEGARKGDAHALFGLGGMYEAGRGVPQDPVQALMWYTLSEQAGFKPSPDPVPRLSASLDSADVRRAQQLAEAWRRGNLSS
jgi:TPR repeat protein